MVLQTNSTVSIHTDTYFAFMQLSKLAHFLPLCCCLICLRDLLFFSLFWLSTIRMKKLHNIRNSYSRLCRCIRFYSARHLKSAICVFLDACKRNAFDLHMLYICTFQAIMRIPLGLQLKTQTRTQIQICLL